VGAITGARLLRATRPSGGTSTAARARAATSRRPTRHARRVRALGAALGGPLAQQDAVAALDGDRDALPKLANKRCPEAVVVQQSLLAMGCGEGPDVSQISQAQSIWGARLLKPCASDCTYLCLGLPHGQFQKTTNTQELQASKDLSACDIRCIRFHISDNQNLIAPTVL